MASSGVTTYSYTRDQIINAALRKLAVLGEGVSANSTQLTTGAEALNLLLLYFQSLGMPLWKRVEISTTMVSGTKSYTLSTKLLKVYQALYKVDTDSDSTQMEFRSHTDFNVYPDTATGNPVVATYVPGVSSGTLEVWPTPDASTPTTMTVTLVGQKEFDVFTASGETLDFPQEWYMAVVYNLAKALAPEYSISPQDVAELRKDAKELLETTLGMGAEDASIFFQPSRS